MDKDLLKEFIEFAKETYNCEITLEPSDAPDTFESIFGASFIIKEKQNESKTNS